ncbi:hypothetical protein AMECASPLE_020663, partial [Ameca splendens]
PPIVYTGLTLNIKLETVTNLNPQQLRLVGQRSRLCCSAILFETVEELMLLTTLSMAE